MKKQVWLCNAQHGAWVPAPATGMNVVNTPWRSELTYLNGGAFTRRSGGYHKNYTLTWNVGSQDELDAVRNFLNGVYGPGPFFFVDPFNARRNVFPAWFAAPGMAGQGAPSLFRNAQPSVGLPNVHGLGFPPSAAYQVTTLAQGRTVRVPIPPGYRLQVALAGQVTSGAVTLRENVSGKTVNWHSPSGPVVSNEFFTTTFADFQFVVNAPSAFTVSGIIGWYQKNDGVDTHTPSVFVAGNGNTGLEPVTDLTESFYSSALPGAQLSVSVTMREVGAWL